MLAAALLLGILYILFPSRDTIDKANPWGRWPGTLATSQTCAAKIAGRRFGFSVSSHDLRLWCCTRHRHGPDGRSVAKGADSSTAPSCERGVAAWVPLFGDEE